MLTVMSRPREYLLLERRGLVFMVRMFAGARSRSLLWLYGFGAKVKGATKPECGMCLGECAVIRSDVRGGGSRDLKP